MAYLHCLHHECFHYSDEPLHVEAQDIQDVNRAGKLYRRVTNSQVSDLFTLGDEFLRSH